MKLFRTCALFMVGILVILAPASAQPVLEIEQPVATVFKPFQTLPEGEVTMIRISAPRDVDFDGELEITPTDAAEFAWPCSEPIAARLNGNLLVRRAASYVTEVSLLAGEEIYLMLRWRPESRTFAEPGRCDMLIDVRLLDDLGTVLDEQIEVPISLQVLADTTLSIAGTSGTTNADRTFAFIDFGELETGEQAFILFNAQANTDVDFTIQSENGGAMVSQDRAEHRIEYSATFDGAPLALASGQVVRRRPEANLQGSRYRLDIQVGDVTGAFSGTYQDNITVEMIAQ
ncbi:hypothetical protein [Erythrobacter ani]|uniref:Spore coat protein U domain-containing protein n=1 Tax=Erythrobacter ani TaxID=2827235 RepID=A0ABS6SN68_9SPHN|nr:hypothetical protein [Erythrobacter ani]MBV7266286.1 hypothetical protein [Erythrobacter ani]